MKKFSLVNSSLSFVRHHSVKGTIRGASLVSGSNLCNTEYLVHQTASFSRCVKSALPLSSALKEQMKVNKNSSHPFENSRPKFYQIFLIGGSAILIANFVGILYFKYQFNELMKNVKSKQTSPPTEEENNVPLNQSRFDFSQNEQLSELITSVTSLIRGGYFPKEFYETTIIDDLLALRDKKSTTEQAPQDTMQKLLDSLSNSLENCSSDTLKSKVTQTINPLDDELNQWVENPPANAQTTFSTSNFVTPSTYYKILCLTTIGSLAFFRLNRIASISQKSRIAIASITLLYSGWIAFFRPYSMNRLSHMFTTWFEKTDNEGKQTIRVPFVHMVFQQYLNFFSFMVWFMMYGLVRFVVLPEVMFNSQILKYIQEQQEKLQSQEKQSDTTVVEENKP